MNYDDNSIFICDPPPSASYVITYDKRLTTEQIVSLKRAWNEYASGPASKERCLVLEEGMELKVFPGRYEWPDAEFCAA